jgi:hypothetical protein
MYKIRIDVDVPGGCKVCQFFDIESDSERKAKKEVYREIKQRYPDLISYNFVFVDKYD